MVAIIATAHAWQRLSSQAVRAADHDTLLARAAAVSAAQPDLANGIAWQFAIDPSTTQSQLAAAQAVAQTVADAPFSAATRNATDTEATLLYRQADFPDAVALEETVLPGWYANFSNQFAYFLYADYHHNGLRQLGGNWGNLTLTITQTPSLALTWSNDVPAKRDAVAYALVIKDGALKAFLFFPIPAGQSGSRAITLSPRQTARLTNALITNHGTLTIARVDTETFTADGRTAVFTYNPQLIEEP